MDDNLTIPEIGYGHRRLHRSMRQQRNIVIGLMNFGRLCEFRIYIADVARYFARLMRGVEERFFISFRLVGRMFSQIPFDLSFLRACIAVHVLSAMIATPPSTWNP